MRLLSIRHITTKIALLLACLGSLYSLSSPSWAVEAEAEKQESETLDSNDTDTDTESSTIENPESKPTAAALYYLPNIPKKRAQSLIHHMELMERQNEIIQLSGLDEDYYGLFLADATGNPQGGVLILHDDQQHGHWPDIVAPLREYLPQHGWTTLSIELPDIPARKRIARPDLTAALSSNSATDTEENETSPDIEPITTNQEGEPLLTEESIDNDGPDLSGQPVVQEDETATDDSLEPALPKLAKLPDLANKIAEESSTEEEVTIDLIEHYRKQNQQRIVAAMEYLRNKGQFNLVIIGYGIGAAWAIDYMAQQEEDTKIAATTKGDNKGLTLVTIDAMPSRHNSMTMNEQLKTLQLPFLDLIQPNKAYSLKQGKVRLAIMKRNKNEQYQQIITSNMASYHEDESPTSRRIRGWLKNNASGTLVKMSP
jgi:hypothetical protein